MDNIQLRTIRRDDWSEVAGLIYDSTNAWYLTNRRSAIFSGPRDCTLLFCQVYEQLDPGCCILAEDVAAGRLAGSCFYHPRDTHVSLGIMNVHPAYFGQGVARRLLRFITDFADESGKPVRLVSSAINLDSFSLYSRAGFVPRMVYQDMILKVPEEGLSVQAPAAGEVREATAADVPAMAALEEQISHIRREGDLAHFVKNADGIWHVSVLENQSGGSWMGSLSRWPTRVATCWARA